MRGRTPRARSGSLANNRLREVLLSRPNGELTRAGQFYYGLVGGPLEAVRRGAAPHPRGAHGLHPPLLGAQEARALPAARQQPPRPTRSSCATRGSATPSPTPAARGSRCGVGCICATPPAHTSKTLSLLALGEGPKFSTQRPAPRSWPATRRRRGASPKNAGCRRRRARPSRSVSPNKLA